MVLSYRRRQLLAGALVANAIRPLPGYWLSVPTMLAGWLTNELAPYVLAATAADTARELARAPRDASGLALAAGSVAGLAMLVRQSQRSEQVVESALRDGLGADYRALLPELAQVPEGTGFRQELPLPMARRPDNVRVERNVRYSDAGKHGLLDVYHPRQTPEGGAPVLLHVHGGAWMSGDKAYEGIPLMHHLAARGWVCVNVNYRLAPAHAFPAHIIDVKRAIGWIRENGHRYGADASFVATSGGSAGGHLAALAALTPNDARYQPGFEDVDTRIQASVPHYGIYDFAADSGTPRAVARRDRFLAPRVMMKDASSDVEEFRRASPLNRVSTEAPPFFVVHGAHDSAVEVEEARHFVTRLREHSREAVVYAELPGTQHAFDILPSIRSGHVVRGVERFLRWAHAQQRGNR